MRIAPLAAFGALRHRDFRLLWSGTCVSFIGGWVQTVALGLYVYELTGSKQALGLIGLASGLPTTLLLLFGGAIADRANKRRLLTVTQSIYALSAFALTALTATGPVAVWQIVAISFLNGAVFAIDGPTRQALVYDIVGPDDLATGVALQSASFNIARVVGPAIAGVLYVAMGPAWCFAVNGLSFGAVIIALRLMHLPAHVERRESVSAIESIRAGFGYLRSCTVARNVVMLTAVASLFGVSNYGTLMPAIARDLLGIDSNDRRYGLLFSAIGAGSLVGVYLVGRHAAMKRRGVLLFAGSLAFSLALIALAHAGAFVAAAPIMVVVGMSAVSQLATANTLTQTLAPAGMRGRAVSLHMMAMAGLQPFGAFMAGAIAQRFGVAASLQFGGAVLLAVCCAMLVRRPEVASLP